MKKTQAKRKQAKAEAKTKIHKIKAEVKVKATKPAIKSAPAVASEKRTKVASQTTKITTKKTKSSKTKKLLSPIIALNRYLANSWRELKKVHWPSRKATWSMTLAVVFYAIFFLVLVLALDNLFSWLFKLMLGN